MTIRSLRLCGAALALACTPAAADVWQGQLTITAATGCSTAGYGVGDTGRSIYRNKVSSTEQPSGLEVIYGRSAVIIVATAASGPGADLNGPTTYSGDNIGGRATSALNAYNGTSTLAITPDSTNKFLSIAGTIDNFTNVSGCTVTVRGEYAHFP